MPGINAAQPGSESPVRVVITPSQSSFFAGEHFSVTVTFTNTRAPEVGPSTSPSASASFASPSVLKPSVQARPQTYTHKRGAHSISSAPLARPPTSPGLSPRSAVTPLPRRLTGPTDDAFPRRRGLVGIVKKSPPSDGQFSELLEQRRKKLLAKSLSVSVSAQELEEQLGEGIVAASVPYSKQAFGDTNQSPTSPHTPSPLARTNALPLSSNHPHARKQSLLDGRFPLDVLSPTTSIPPRPSTPPPPNASLSLDTISESLLSGYPSTSTTTTPSPTSPPTPSYTQTITFPSGSGGGGSVGGPNTVQAYPSTSAASHYQPPHHHHTRRFSQQIQLGLGQPPLTAASSSSSNNNKNLQVPPAYPRTAFSSTFPQTQTELILYSYAQLVGTVCVIPEKGDKDGGIPVTTTPATTATTATTTTTLEQKRRMDRVRGALVRKRVVVGGGSMDITHTQSLYAGGTGPVPDPRGGGDGSGEVSYPGQPRKRPAGAHRRSASFSVGLMSLLSTGTGGRDQTMLSSSSPVGNHQINGGQVSRQASGMGSGTLNGGGGGGVAPDENIDPELPLPTFEAQPSMLAVDLFLFPGESRSYTYSIKLPDVLPPTYQGRSLMFSYELVVGTCRAGSSSPKSNPGMGSVSRVMKVPIRVYNHVTVHRPPRPYDILWPVSHSRVLGLGKGREIPEAQGKVVEETGGMMAKLKKTTNLSLAKSSVEGSLEELKEYTARLLASLPPVVNEKEEPSSPVGREAGLRMSLDDAREHEEEEDRALAGCRGAVEILTRMPKKASYDVNKDGVRVAVLTFTKSAYRLGETVSGVVELNERKGRARVLQLSAVLEAHETLPSSVSSVRSLKRAYAEHSASFTLNTLRMAFALDIPSDASPAFQVRINDSEDPLQPGCVGGLEWKVRLCLLVAVSSGDSDTGTEGVSVKSLERDGPRGEWGSSWRAPKRLAPLEKSRVFMKSEPTRSWTQLFVDSMWSVMVGEEGSHTGEGDEDDEDERGYDGIRADAAGGVGIGVDYGGGEGGWRGLRLETVECEVGIEVWPGNTAFRAVDVVFDV